MSNTSQINTRFKQCERNTEVIEHQVHQISSSQQATVGLIMEVPTFRPITATVTRRSDATPSKEQDPFLYFSNQDRRMTYLLRNGKEQVEGDASNLNDSTTERMVEEERRQRISFEVHPDLMYLEDLLLEGHDLDEADVFDLLFDDAW